MPRSDLKTLIQISRHYGADPEFVLAGGGNTSYKSAEHLYVKASGHSLADIDETGFVKMRRADLARMWRSEYPAEPRLREARVLADLLAARADGERAGRPSVETPLHDFFEQPYVVHTHPPLVNGLTCARQGERRARELFGEEVLWIPAVNPGYVLAATVREAMLAFRRRRGRSPDILLFQNHGLCVAGEGLEDIRRKTDVLLDVLKRQLKETPDFSSVDFDRERAAALAPAIRMLLMAADGSSIVGFDTSVTAARLLSSRRAFAGVSTSFSPDHIVYCNHQPLFVPARASLEQQYQALSEGLAAYRESNGFAPRIVAVEKLGVFAWGADKKNSDIGAAVFRDALKIAVYSRSFGGPRPLPPEQVEFIKEWEVEAFRRRVSAGERPPGRMAGRIALVTGAAQGFGLGLTEALLKEGAHVVLADLNAGEAAARAAELARRHGAGRARAQAVDVGDEPSVREMISATVLGYGGLDLLVNNAGVLEAGGLEELDPARFEFVNRVNYTGYYLCCRHASAPMKIQHRFRPGRSMDIVQINSKSGLSGSNRNFAYAGSKFGAIGLTQSFALELVEHNIKVNAICPGNFYDGPLWSDPKRGLFVQYLKTGKVPGARSVEEVRRFYEAKVPMGRGCRIEDVARALLYVVEQAYETGQALPVTGGQIMLK